MLDRDEFASQINYDTYYFALNKKEIRKKEVDMNSGVRNQKLSYILYEAI